MRHLPVVSLGVLMSLIVPWLASPVFADPATDRARGHYETGLELFYAREHAQALVEFQRAHQVKPRPATLFMMGQCEYLLGSLRQARDHYEAYLRDSPTGEFVEVAKDRVESINRRPATLVINTVPDQVDVRIARIEEPETVAPPTRPPPASTSPGGRAPAADPANDLNTPPRLITGQAPNNFSLSRGRWTITVSKPNYQSQEITVNVEVADTKPLFFKLEPIPARLEIETLPPGATLYVNGNRAQNPYRQNISPGPIELFAQATNFADRTERLLLGPGDRRLLIGPDAFRLRYVQRSGRPELLVASVAMGALFGAGALAGTVAAASETSADVATVSLILGGALAGGIGGALVGNRFVPSYIPDNRAVFIIGAMWIGVAEGALTAMSINQLNRSTVNDPVLGAYLERPTLSLQLNSAFIGSVPGIVLGTTAGALLANHAPTYGRVALIQSAAVGGALVGGLTAVALQWQVSRWQSIVRGVAFEGETCTPLRDPTTNKVVLDPDGARICPASASLFDLSLPALIGLNVGLAAGLLGAYLPDQSRYGPSWTRIALIDLAVGAGALGAGIFACVSDDEGCLKSSPKSAVRARTAGASLLGAAAGLVAGILLTRNVDANATSSDDGAPPTLSMMPMPTFVGGSPGLGAIGIF